jgi:hypothetical protein
MPTWQMVSTPVSTAQSRKKGLKKPTFMTSAATAADPHQSVQECAFIIVRTEGWLTGAKDVLEKVIDANMADGVNPGSYSTAQSRKKGLKKPTFMTSAATAADPHQSVQECVLVNR